MELIINQELCNGCGACVEACPYAAIYMHNGKAFIDQSKCAYCQSCIAMCPTGAVQLIKTERQIVSVKPTSVEVVHAESATNFPQKQTNWGGTMLSLLGQYALPRMVDVLATYLERKSSKTEQVQTPSAIPAYGNNPYRRRRQRRGRMMS